VSGLVFVVCIIGGFLFLWSFLLVWLKCHGYYVGCAAGRPFEARKTKTRKGLLKEKPRVDPVDSVEPKNLRPEITGTIEHRNDDGIDTSCSDIDDWSDLQLSPDQRTEKPPATSYPNSGGSTDVTGKSGSLYRTGAKLSKSLEEADSIPGGNIDETQAPLPSMRERRTQCCFILFAFATTACVPLVLTMSVKPLLAVSSDVSSILDEIGFRFVEARSSLSAVSESTKRLSDLSASAVNETYNNICPFTADVENKFSLNLENVYNLIASQDLRDSTQETRNIDEMVRVLEAQESVITDIEKYKDLADQYAWLPPVLLFLMGLLALLLAFGVYLTWDRASSLRFQNFLSYFILPALIICSLCCWVAVCGSAVTTSIAFDFCVSEGSPSQTIASLLEELGYPYGSSAHDFTLNYVVDCSWADPMEFLEMQVSQLNTMSELIRSTISMVDSIGRSTLVDSCGDINGEVASFLDASTQIVSRIAVIQDSIQNATAILACESISEAYDNLVNKSMCDTGAAAFAWSFVFFLVAGVSTLSLVSMRASWRHKVIEYKIFDESEVAVNMVVDEHEDYLTFISKYRQEWEEYQGVNDVTNGPTQIAQGYTETIGDSFSTISNNVNMAGSQATLGTNGPSTDGTELSELKSTFDPYNSDSQSNTGTESEGSISFLSLKGSQDDVILPPLLNVGSDLETEENFDAEAYGTIKKESEFPQKLLISKSQNISIVDRTPPSRDGEI
jgi:hypothetical protein